MKANDLMVGDFLQRTYNHKIVRVREIKQNCIYTKDNGYDYSEVEPIPLTPEILEKIGFESQHNVGYVLEHYDDDTIIVDLWNHTLKILMNYKVVFEKEYFDTIPLHELQHALKLCGITHEIII